MQNIDVYFFVVFGVKYDPHMFLAGFMRFCVSVNRDRNEFPQL